MYYCIKQKEKKDCACACLATICKQYGLKIPIGKIREYTNTDMNGTNIRGIFEASKILGLSCKAFKVNSFDDIYDTNIHFPAIAHVIVNNAYYHYIVIHKITNKYILIADPARGIVKYNIDEFSNIWTGIIIVLSKTSQLQSYDNGKSLFKKFLILIKPHKSILINIFLCSIFITIIGIVSSFYFQFILNTVIPNDLTSTLNIFSIGLMILTIFSIISTTLRKQMLLHFTQKLDISLMLKYYNHIINLPMKFFHTRTTGEVISRLEDAYKIRTTISGAILTIMVDGLMMIIGGITLFIESKYLFFITLIPLIFYLIIVYIFKKSIEKNNRNTMQSQAKLTSYLIECLHGIETIKAFNIEDETYLNIEKSFIKYMKDIFNLGTINNFQMTLKIAVKAIFGIAILWIGTTQVLNGIISIGTLLTFNALLAYFLIPIENIINFQSKIQGAIVAGERLEEIIEYGSDENNEKLNKIKFVDLKGDIEFKNLKFRYGSRSLILNDINIKIKKNEKIALVGESGSGKTTLSKLLMGFYPVNEGEILVNNYNINDINTVRLREKIAYVSQETFLFNKTIFENLIIGKNNISYKQVIEACKKAQIHDFINTLPAKYNTLIEENGINFSGGQKQRLSIARAILKNPDILIMDEATSNLDSITEKAINNTINDFMKDKTAIIITHRLSTVKNCDNIYVLKKGKIIENGNHNELINKKGFYYNLWSSQTLNFNIENLGGSAIE